MVSGDHLHGAHLFSFSLWANLGSDSLEQPWEGCSKDKDSGIILVSRANRSKSSDDNDDDNGENQTLTVDSLSLQNFPTFLGIGVIFCFIRMIGLQPREVK